MLNDQPSPSYQPPHEPLPSPFDDGELYDLLFQGIPYGLEFYTQLAQQAQGPVLDIACGTGRILLPLLSEGIDIEGLDNAPSMLATLRGKIPNAARCPRLTCADMSDFHLDREFALIMIPFNAFGHNLTQTAQLRCLELCRDHLRPGGVLAFDAYFPGWQIVGAVQNTRVLEMEWPHPVTGNPLKLYDTRSFDRVEQIQHSVNEIEVYAANGDLQTTYRSEHRIRWIYKDEMALLLRAAGFAGWEICGDFDRRPLVNEGDAMIVLARK